MKKVVFIIPFFGKFPPYFEMWLKSVKENDTIDFLIISDNDIKKDLPGNVSLLLWSFKQFQLFVQSKFEFEIALDFPYKICDFRPAFGYIFQEYIAEYDFWGHCDIDCMFGDLRKHLNSYMEQHDAIGTYGHLSLYKNCENINSCFRKEGAVYDYREVFSNPENYAFDEKSGIKRIFKFQKIDCKYELDMMADIATAYRSFQLLHGMKNYQKQIFIWQKGKVLQCYLEHSKLQYKELMYLHFQKKNLVPNEGIYEECYLFYNVMMPRKGSKLDFKMLKYQSFYRNRCFKLLEKAVWILKKLWWLATMNQKQRNIYNTKRKFQ